MRPIASLDQEGLPVAEINLFRNARNHRRLAAGEAFFDVDDDADAMDGVISGKIELFRGDDLLETVGPGGVFGEVALLSGHRRSAAARAASDSVIAVVDEADFLRLVKMNAFFSLEVMRLPAERLQSHG